ncbi:MAG: tetratricopeptide repeat protein [Spirochaetes bacterium]|nr:tetratricopeptide repeat protein [Spirochaetota bacterium]
MKRIVFTIYIFLIITRIALYAIESSQLFEQGMEAFRMGNYGSSELIFRKIIDANDSYKDKAWYYLALSIFYQKQYRSAIFELNRFLLLCTTPDLCSEARYWIAESYFFLNDYIKSIEEYNRFIAQSKNKQLIINAYDRIGEIYFNQKRYDEAIIEWKKALTISSKKYEDSNRIIKIGEALFLSERYDEALDMLEPLIHATSDTTIASKARLLVGRIYQLMGKHWQAIKYLNEIPDSMLRLPSFMSVQYFKALSYIALGDIYNARLNLKSYIMISTDDVPYHYNAKYELGKILLNTKDLDEGIALLEEVYTNSNDIELRSKASFELAKVYLKNNNNEKAIPYLENATSISEPENQKYVMMTLTRLYITTARYDDAKRLLDFMLEKYQYEENRDEMLFLLAQVYVIQGDITKALETFEAIKENNPFSQFLIELDYVKAIDAFKRERYNDAIEYGNKYLKNQKIENRYEVLILLAESYIKIKNTQKATEAMDQLITRFPKKVGLEEVIYDLSIVLKEQGVNVDKYYSFITKNYYTSITAGKVFIEKGDEAYKKKNYQAAANYYAQYLATKGRPRERSVLLFYVLSLYELKQYHTIIKILQGSDYLNIDDLTTKLLIKWLAKSLYAIKDYTTALLYFMKVPLQDYNKDDLLIIADTALNNRQPDIAIEIIPYVEDEENYYVTVCYSIAQYYRLNGDNTMAIDYYSKVLLKKPDSSKSDDAKISLAQIYLERKEFEKALELIQYIRKKEVENVQYSIMAIAYFNLGNYDKALNISLGKLNTIIKTEYADDIIKYLLLYYYEQNDRKNYQNIYTYGVKRNKLISLSNYYYGLLLYKNSNYTQALNYFTIASRYDDEYAHESLYYAGLIYMFIQRNLGIAKRYFDLYVAKTDVNANNYSYARIYISMLLYESGKTDESRDLLYSIVSEDSNVLAKIKATHLITQYGF